MRSSRNVPLKEPGESRRIPLNLSAIWEAGCEQGLINTREQSLTVIHRKASLFSQRTRVCSALVWSGLAQRTFSSRQMEPTSVGPSAQRDGRIFPPACLAPRRDGGCWSCTTNMSAQKHSLTHYRHGGHRIGTIDIGKVEQRNLSLGLASCW